jgi:DNA-binding NarL/FixJ family response regulator
MGKKILVVEDEIVIADEICLILNKAGYSTLEPALNYVEATIAFDNERPDLLILDVKLSGKKSGIDVARYVRKRSQAPFLFLTAYGDPKSLEEMKSLEPLACLQKAFKKKELLDKVAQGLGIKRTVLNTNKSLTLLTRMEKVVLGMIAENLTTRQIAQNLDLSESTIKNHRHSICRKLDLPTSTHSLLHWALINREKVLQMT